MAFTVGDKDQYLLAGVARKHAEAGADGLREIRALDRQHPGAQRRGEIGYRFLVGGQRALDIGLPGEGGHADAVIRELLRYGAQQQAGVLEPAGLEVARGH